MSDEDRVYLCNRCHTEKVEYRRWKLGYLTCLGCAEMDAIEARKSWCVVPLHKSNYMLVTNRDILTGVNNKGGLVK